MNMETLLNVQRPTSNTQRPMAQAQGWVRHAMEGTSAAGVERHPAIRPFWVRLMALFIFAMLGGCGNQEGPKQAAERFFTLCSRGKPGDAYNSSATMFQLERSPKYFEARLRELMLDRAEDIQFGTMTSRGSAYIVPVKLKLPGGKPLELSVSMVEENGQWRVLEVRQEFAQGVAEDVFSVKARGADTNLISRNKTFTEPVATAVPTQDQMQDLVEEALLKFDEAVKAADFSNFLEFVSDRWKFRGKDPRILNYTGNDPDLVKQRDPNNRDGRITKFALESSFRPFVDAKVDLTAIKGKKMKLDVPAAVNTEGVLEIKGRYDTFVFAGANPPTPKKLTFKLEFVLEGAKWKLFGISVDLK
jgi:hypothetical protein